MPKVKQVVGGVHATLITIYSINSAIDYTVRREGEMAMLSLVNGVNPKLISGVISRDGSKLINLVMLMYIKILTFTFSRR